MRPPRFDSRKLAVVRFAVTGMSAALLATTALVGCAALQQVAALRKVDFAIDRVDRVRIAGILVDNKSSYRDLTATDVARLGAAVLSKDVPFELVVHVTGENPPENSVTARLVQMDWTVFIEDNETVSGRLAEEYLFPPGESVDVPIPVDMDLYEFFSGRATDLFNIALAVAGRGEPTNVKIKARPTIQTPIGPIRYPEPITIVSKDIDRI